MKKGLGFIILLIVMGSQSAWAHHRYFVGGTLAVATQKETNTDNLYYGLAGGVLGSHLRAGYSVEARLGFGLNQDSGTVDITSGPFIGDTVKFKARLDYYLTGLVRFDVAFMDDQAQLYGLLGLTQYEGSVESSSPVARPEGDFSGSDVSWGFGVSYDFLERVRIGLEWINLVDEPSVDVRFYGLRVTVPFG